jgi:hypothetical protein
LVCPEDLPHGFLHKSVFGEDAFVKKPAFANIIGGAAGISESKQRFKASPKNHVAQNYAKFACFHSILGKSRESRTTTESSEEKSN